MHLALLCNVFPIVLIFRFLRITISMPAQVILDGVFSQYLLNFQLLTPLIESRPGVTSGALYFNLKDQVLSR